MIRHYYLCLFLGILSAVQAEPFIEARQAFQFGYFEQTISQWQTVLATTSTPSKQLAAWLGMARAYRQLGLYKKALNSLNTALPIAEQTGNLNYHTLLLAELSKLHLSKGEKEYGNALQYAEQALEMGEKTNNRLILADVLRHQGNVLTVEYDYEGAIDVYRQALDKIPPTLRKIGSPETLSDFPLSREEMIALSGNILISLAQATLLLDKENVENFADKKQAFKKSIVALESAFQATQNWQPATYSYSQTFALITLSQIAQQVQAHLDEASVQLTRITYHALNAAQKMAEELNNPVAKAFSYGYLGKLYQQAKRYNEALFLTRQAIFFAQQTRKQPFLYVWQRQMGHIYKAQSNQDSAIKAYQQAVTNFRPVQFQMATTGYLNITQTFREKTAPLYFELADLRLQKARATQNVSLRENLLRQARKTIEGFKEAELQDYFQSECLNFGTDCAEWQQILDAQTAVLYPILLPDRLELLLEQRDNLIQATVPVSEKKLRSQVNSFLLSITSHPNQEELSRTRNQQVAIDTQPDEMHCTFGTWNGEMPEEIKMSEQEFFQPAQKLYSWLIEPLLPHLQNIKTLVIVPDGILRTMPFSALHDGKQFLIQKYALAILPSLCVKESPIPLASDKILLGGLSEAVQGFSALPCAQVELNALQQLYDKVPEPLLNETFTVHNLNRNIKENSYSILHIASHGQFNADLESTFILTYEDKLTMDKLERLISFTKIGNKQPLELLTLSACETAVGDDLAALGLAGVALKAGAKTAFASLWKVDDEATPAVVIEFYRQLRNPGISKAVALQKAQNFILTNKQYAHYRHPYYWSAFLLIGQWL